ncbi:MAG: HlyD family efflux transporter periplasmic adaptor subunit [Nitrospira sp.]|nr:HlyD family efflux transporter periplasmic adaptor subunit [Nitrospira sp.]
MDSQTEVERQASLREAAAQIMAESVPSVEEDHRLWATFAEAATVEAFCQSWLALQCGMIGGVKAGLVLLGPPDRGPYRPVATWPFGRRNLKHLTKTAERTLAERRGLVVKSESDTANTESPGDCYEVSYPIEVRGVLHGATVLEIPSRSDDKIKGAMRRLHWGAAWLELLFSRESVALEISARERIQSAMELISSTLGHERCYGAAMAFATALATKLECERVSIGFVDRGRMRVFAMSHSAEFKQQTNLVRSISEAMDEAVDQRETIVYPKGSPGSIVVSRAHGELAKQHGSGALCSIPLEALGVPIGALVLERPLDRPFDTKAIELCQSVAALAGPILDQHRRDDRWLIAKAADSARSYLISLFGPQHVALKLVSIGVVGLVLFCLLVKGDYRVSAKTVLEPIVQRAATAPFNGYIREAPVRAGDLVQAGQVLCTLDDRELRLERLKSLSKFEEYQKEYHKAMAEGRAAKVEILTAQTHQVEAEIALLNDQLNHTKLLAPFDGIVVTGDLSQQLGAPVEKGKVLFEIAPLDSYRLVIEVDERDIADVVVGQRGSLMLSAFPSEIIDVTVEKITPVSTAKEGRNFFRIDAQFDQPHDRLRPGMEGAGKIEIDRRSLLWIWTHQIVDWMRLAVWSWMP